MRENKWRENKGREDNGRNMMFKKIIIHNEWTKVRQYNREEREKESNYPSH